MPKVPKLEETVRITKVLKPVYNFKAQSDDR